MTNRFAFACLLAVATAPAWAADQPTPPDMEVRIVEMKHLTGERLRSVANSMRSVLQPDGTATYDSNLNVIVLKGMPRQLAGIDALLKKADVPEPAKRPDPQVQLRVHLVVASPDEGKDGPVAPEIASAIEQMRKAFAYRSYRELDTLVLQVRNEASAATNGILPVETPRPEAPSVYSLNVDNVSVFPDTGAVNLRNFRLNATMRVGTQQAIAAYEAGLRTDVTIQKGQKVVVGKLSGDNRKDAIFLVLAADVL